MKKTLLWLLCGLLALAVAGCAASPSVSDDAAASVDLDLTQMSGTMAYSEVYNMAAHPEEYQGKTVKVSGPFSIYTNETTGQQYFACLISDATACCAQGMEFVLRGEHQYPDDYPEVGSEVTVTGVFDPYEEDGYMYCRLSEAELTDSGAAKK